MLIFAAGLTGWLPGPGGIPLLIVGLSVLATNHEWAERLLGHVKKGGVQISKTLFNGHPLIRLAIDILGIVFIAAAVIILSQVTKNIAQSAAISLLVVAGALLLGNRNRFLTLKNWIKKT